MRPRIFLQTCQRGFTSNSRHMPTFCMWRISDLTKKNFFFHPNSFTVKPFSHYIGISALSLAHRFHGESMFQGRLWCGWLLASHNECILVLTVNAQEQSQVTWINEIVRKSLCLLVQGDTLCGWRVVGKVRVHTCAWTCAWTMEVSIGWLLSCLHLRFWESFMTSDIQGSYFWDDRQAATGNSFTGARVLPWSSCLLCKRSSQLCEQRAPSVYQAPQMVAAHQSRDVEIRFLCPTSVMRRDSPETQRLRKWGGPKNRDWGVGWVKDPLRCGVQNRLEWEQEESASFPLCGCRLRANERHSGDGGTYWCRCD